MDKQTNPIDKKPAPALGLRAPVFFRGSKFSGKFPVNQPKFNPSQFRTQHKG